jgi:5-methylthioribose kinase
MAVIDDSTLIDVLEGAGFPVDRSVARVESAGEGNINFVRRVWVARDHSVIVKHARPTLERFPEYTAPTERLCFEARYMRAVDALLGRGASPAPRILHFDPELPWLVLEDVGPGPNLHDATDTTDAPSGALRALGRFLARVHTASAGRVSSMLRDFENAAMQALHGEHIFTLPYTPNAFPVDPEIREAADALLEDDALRRAIESLRAHYYGDRAALVHGDVQSTNLLLRGSELRLIDAEIAHIGDPAFDLGTALAHVHVHIARAPDRRDARAAAIALAEGYVEGGGTADSVRRAEGYAGVELLRRTLGAARFPAASRSETSSPAAAVRVLRHGASLLRASRPS